MVAIDAINAVVQKEILGSQVYDNPRCQLFTDWRFTGFQQDPTAAMMRGYVTALHIPSQQRVQHTVVMNADFIDHSANPAQLFKHIDYAIEQAVENILALRLPEPHTPGQLCESNPFCEECYS